MTQPSKSYRTTIDPAIGEVQESTAYDKVLLAADLAGDLGEIPINSLIRAKAIGDNMINPTIYRIGLLTAADTNLNTVGGVDYRTTEKIPCLPETTYYCPNTGGASCRARAFYKTDQTPLDSGAFVDGAVTSFTTPAGCYFVEVSWHSDSTQPYLGLVDVSSAYKFIASIAGLEPHARKVSFAEIEDELTTDKAILSKASIIDLIDILGNSLKKISTNQIPPEGWTQGFYLNPSNGNEQESSNYMYSPPLYLEPDTLYTGLILQGVSSPGVFRHILFYDENDVLLTADNLNAWTDSFTTPADQAYTVVSSYGEDYSTGRLPQWVGLFKGLNPVWEDWYDGYFNFEQVQQLNLAKADKTLVCGNSYTYGTGNMQGKSWVNKLSEYLNLNIVNYGTGGYRIVDITDDLRNNEAKFGTIGARDLKPRYVTVGVIGNETVSGYDQINSDLYREELNEVLLAVRGIGAELVLSTDHRLNHVSENNHFIEALVNQFADENGLISHCIGSLGNVLANETYGEFYHGSHPGSRVNAYTFIEWLYLMSQLPVSKSLKIFRPRSGVAVSDVSDLNYDTIKQRAILFREIEVGEGKLVDETLYDQLDALPALETKDDEYLAFQSGVALSFTDYALFDCTIDQVNVTMLDLILKGDAGLTIYVKNNFDDSTYAPTYKDNTGVIFQVSKSVYNNITAVAGDTYTTPDADQTLIYDGKFYHPFIGYILGFHAAAEVTTVDDATGTLTRATGSGNATIAYTLLDGKLTEHSFEFISTIYQAEGSWEAVTADYADGVYTVNLSNIYKYLLNDNVKVLVAKAGAFEVSDFTIEYLGGKKKQNFYTDIKRKKNLSNVLFNGGFPSDWETVWTNTDCYREQIAATVRNYPSINSEDYHITFTHDADGVPSRIARSFSVSSARAPRKMIVRVIAQLFPKVFNTGLSTGLYVTHTQQISPDSYDYDYLCIGLKIAGQQEVVFKHLVNIGWAECYFEVEIPPFQTDFELAIFRDTNPQNEDWDMHVYDVNVSHE